MTIKGGRPGPTNGSSVSHVSQIGMTPDGIPVLDRLGRHPAREGEGVTSTDLGEQAM